MVLFLETAQTLPLASKRQEAKAMTSFQGMKPRVVQGQCSSDEEGERPGTGQAVGRHPSQPLRSRRMAQEE